MINGKKIFPAVLSEASRTQATLRVYFSNDTVANQRGCVLGISPSRNAFPSPLFAFSNPSRWAAGPLLRCSCLSLCLEASAVKVYPTARSILCSTSLNLELFGFSHQNIPNSRVNVYLRSTIASGLRERKMSLKSHFILQF